MDARAKQRLGGADFPDRSVHVSSEIAEVPGHRIGQGPLGLSPNEFVGIEFRSVGREAMDTETGMPLDKNLNASALVDGAAIPEQDHGSSQMLQEIAEEAHHFQPRNVGAVEPSIEAHSLAGWGDRKSRDGRQAQPLVQVPQLRCSAAGRPGVTDVGDEQEPTFVEEHQMGSLLKGVFLYAAIGNASNGQWRLRRAPAPGAGASGRSSPVAPSIARRVPDGSELGTVEQSGVRSEAASIRLLSSRRPAGQRPDVEPVALFETPRVAGVVPGWVVDAGRLCLPADGLGTIGLLN